MKAGFRPSLGGGALNSFGKANVNAAFVCVSNTSYQVKTIGKCVKVALDHCGFKGIGGGSRAKNLYFFYLDICYSPIFLFSKIGSYLTQLSLILIL